jgi:hypothetical protein
MSEGRFHKGPEVDEGEQIDTDMQPAVMKE